MGRRRPAQRQRPDRVRPAAGVARRRATRRPTGADRGPTVNRVTAMQTGPVTVAVPATSANLGPGFDVLGLALDLEDEVTAEVGPDGFHVEVSGEGAGEVPGDESHLIVATMLRTFAVLGVAAPAGLRLTCRNRIPHARGLGSSSAAIVAGILLARALVGEIGYDPRSLIWAAEIEGHPDNVAPCLLGGFTIAWTSDE